MQIAGSAPQKTNLFLSGRPQPIEDKSLALEKLNPTGSMISKEGDSRTACMRCDAAVAAREYDAAIKEYEAGLVADAGNYAFLLDEAVVLDKRGVQVYNAALALTDKAARDSALEAAKRDLTKAVELATKASQLIKSQPRPDDLKRARYEADKMLGLRVRADAMSLFITKVDRSQVDVARAAFEEYIAAEPEANKKSGGERALALMLYDVGDFENAQVQYEKILAQNPDDVDVLAKLGLILFKLGALKDREGKKDEAKIKYQQAANYLQRVVDEAPDTNKAKADAKTGLSELQNEQNVRPAREARPARRP
jgi:tetratricopeptide (TPR) repeat protein